jgi:hypothetical protein
MATSVVIVHDIPGRLRLRGIPPAGLEAAADAVRQVPGVSACQASPRTGSLLVQYRPGETTPDAIVGCVTDEAERPADDTALADHVEPGPARRAAIGTALMEAFGEMDQRIGRFTGGALSLRLLLPLGLGAWALREIALGRTGPLAWSTALWYAHGLFRDYSVPPANEAIEP